MVDRKFVVYDIVNDVYDYDLNESALMELLKVDELPPCRIGGMVFHDEERRERWRVVEKLQTD